MYLRVRSELSGREVTESRHFGSIRKRQTGVSSLGALESDNIGWIWLLIGSVKKRDLGGRVNFQGLIEKFPRLCIAFYPGSCPDYDND